MKVDLRDISWNCLDKYINTGKVNGVDAKAYEKVTADTSFAFWAITIGELIEVTKGKLPKRLQEWLNADLSAYEYIARLKGWREWIKKFGELMGLVGDIKPETDFERYVRKAMPEMSAEESLLLFTRRYFGLTTFAQAEGVALGDYYLARKDDYAKRLAEKKAQKWQDKERKKIKRRARHGANK